VPEKVEQINDSYTSNNIKIGVNDMTVNDGEMCVKTTQTLIHTPNISHGVDAVNVMPKTLTVHSYARRKMPQHNIVKTVCASAGDNQYKSAFLT